MKTTTDRWNDVRAEYRKMSQMGWQSIVQAAKVGAMLIELKAQCPHGEWAANLARALSLESPSAANTTASRLMRLAANMPLLENHEPKPDSQRAALALIPKKRKAATAKKPGRVGWTRAAEIILGELPKNYSRNTLAQTRSKKAEIEKELGREIPSFVELDSAEAREIAAAIERCAKRRRGEPETPAAKVEKGLPAKFRRMPEAEYRDLRQKAVNHAIGRCVPSLRRAATFMIGYAELMQLRGAVCALLDQYLRRSEPPLEVIKGGKS